MSKVCAVNYLFGALWMEYIGWKGELFGFCSYIERNWMEMHDLLSSSFGLTLGGCGLHSWGRSSCCCCCISKGQVWGGGFIL